MSYRQYKFATSTGREVVCWLEDDSRIKRGRLVSFEDSEEMWTCIERYKVLVEDRPRQDWNNNI